MRDLWEDFCNFIWVNQYYFKKAFKGLFVIALIFSYFWNNYFKIKVYQSFFGKPFFDELIISKQDLIKDFDEKVEKQNVNIAGYEIEIEPVKHYAVTGKVVYVDRYNNPFGTYYRSSGNKSVYLYDSVVPLDLSIAHGKTATPSNLEKIEFDHNYRYLSYRWKEDIYFDNKEINNNHIIPATREVEKALEVVKKGDTVYLEGYLVNWKGVNEFKDISFKTAIYSGEMSKERYGGMDTGLCRQILVTKIIFNGYSFE